jgi:hypothetical protein
MTTAVAEGGSLRFDWGASGYFEDCVFRNNSASSGSTVRGGALCAWYPGAIVMRRCVLRDNLATSAGAASGGVLYIYGATSPTVLSSSWFISNRVVVSYYQCLNSV